MDLKHGHNNCQKKTSTPLGYYLNIMVLTQHHISLTKNRFTNILGNFSFDQEKHMSIIMNLVLPFPVKGLGPFLKGEPTYPPQK